MIYRECSHHIIISCSPIVVYQSENMKNIDNGQSNCMSICVMEWCRETWIAVLLCTDTGYPYYMHVQFTLRILVVLQSGTKCSFIMFVVSMVESSNHKIQKCYLKCWERWYWRLIWDERSILMSPVLPFNTVEDLKILEHLYLIFIYLIIN